MTKLIIKKRLILQYISIYWMMILNQSNLYRYFLRPYRSYILVWMSLLLSLCFFKKKSMDVNYLIYLFLAVIFVRIWAGGTGVETYADYAIPIIATVYAVFLDKKTFVENFIKVTIFICVCSLIGTVMGYIYPQLIKTIGIQYSTVFGVSTWTTATDYSTVYYQGYGVLFFSWIDRVNYIRNIGIFTEPGIFQMVINSAMFMLLYMKNWLNNMAPHKLNVYLAILIATLITCQSTTGFICGSAIIVGYLWDNNKDNKKLRKQMIFLISGVVIFLCVDFGINDTASIVESVVINKLFNEEGVFSLTSSSSGAARLGTIFVCLQSMFYNPLGIGTVNTGIMIVTDNSANVAGALVAFGATMGIIPFIVTMVWLFRPILKSDIGKMAQIVFIYIYINISLAQSSIFYPALIAIPIIIRNTSKINKKKYNFDTRR